MNQPVILNALSNPQVIKLLLSGKVGVIPTDTVYGLVCCAADEAAVTRLYALKNRQTKPGTVIAASIDQLVQLGIKKRYLTAVAQYWPNPLSIEIPHQLSYLNQGTGRQAFRIPKDEALRTLLEHTGPLQTTSANQPGEPEATTVAAAQNYFGDQVDFYVEGGDLSGRKPSTLIRVVDDAIEVIRHGAVDIDETGRIS